MKYLCLVFLDEKRLDGLPEEDCVEYDAAIRPIRETVAQAEVQQWKIIS